MIEVLAILFLMCAVGYVAIMAILFFLRPSVTKFRIVTSSFGGYEIEMSRDLIFYLEWVTIGGHYRNLEEAKWRVEELAKHYNYKKEIVS